MIHPSWAANLSATSIPVVRTLRDLGVRYEDSVRLTNGWIYEIIGDVHPEYGFLVEPNYAFAPHTSYAQRGGGMVRIRNSRWPDGSLASPLLKCVRVPLYGRICEVASKDEVIEIIKPEISTKRILADPKTEREAIFAELHRDLTKFADVEPQTIAINGSFARGLAIALSDFDLAVYGSEESRRVAAAVRTLVSTAGSRWNRWTFEEDSVLGYTWRYCYPSWSRDDFLNAFEITGRDMFKAQYRGVNVSFSFHSSSRHQKLPDYACDFTTLSPPQPYVGRFSFNQNMRHLDFPIFAELEDVYCLESGLQLGSCTVVSWSKAFYYCRANDIVRFAACEPAESRSSLLIIPNFGHDWPVTIIEFSDN